MCSQVEVLAATKFMEKLQNILLRFAILLLFFSQLIFISESAYTIAQVELCILLLFLS